MIRLISKQSTRSSRGVTSKGWYELDSERVFVKGNTPGGFEPYSEVMGFRIAKLFGIESTDYWLMPAILFPAINVYGIEHVSVCRDFCYDDFYFIPAEIYITSKFRGEPKDWYEACKEYKDVLNLENIIWLDSIIGNDDRHLNNFGVFRNIKGVEERGPIYDNGSSLLSRITYDNLDRLSRRFVYDKARPFRSKHRVQRKLFETPEIRSISSEDIFKALDSVLKLLPIGRAEAIIMFLNWRLQEYGIS